MIESVFIIIGCYLFSAAMVHAVHRWNPHWQRSSIHYVLVTKDSEARAELVLRAISLYAWLCGKEARITVVDEGSKDQTLDIMERLDVHQRMQIVQTGSWHETERVVRHFYRGAKIANSRSIGSRTSGRGPDTQSVTHTQKGRTSVRNKRQLEQVTVIYVNRHADRAKVPLFSSF